MNCRFNNIISISLSEFLCISESHHASNELISQVKKGFIFIVKGVISPPDVSSIISYFKSSQCTSDFHLTTSPQVRQGCSNFRYISNFISDNPDNYDTSDRSFYIFPWNHDHSPITSLLTKYYDAVLRVQGYSPQYIHSNTPADSIVQRIHLIHYPSDTGRITTHVDPDNVCSLVSGTYLTQFGQDYHAGGFYVINKDSQMVLIDPMIESGDSVLFYPQLPHGVLPVSSTPPAFSQGRYFIDMKVVESHEVQQRSFTRAFSTKK